MSSDHKRKRRSGLDMYQNRAIRLAQRAKFLGREIAQPRSFSEQTAQDVDTAVRALLKEAEECAIAIIGSHRTRIDRLIAALEQRESLDRREINAALGPRDSGIASAEEAGAAA